MANENKKELKLELTPEVAAGHYANFALIAHSPNEFFIDFVAIAPNMPQAKVQSRVIVTPENAKNILFALRDNIAKYEATFGEIKPKMPKTQPNNNGGDLPNPFMA